MTDKEIIIDGVDVSGCFHYKNQSCIADYLLTDQDFSNAKCAYSPNCHFKQLQRKTQECEELKKGYAELTKIVSPYMDDFTGYNEELGGFDPILCVKELCQQLAHKMQENEELKKNNQILCDLYKNVDSCLQKRTEKFDRYRKAFEEIKEIVKDWYKNEWSCYMCRKNMDKKLEDILDIINKAKRR